MLMASRIAERRTSLEPTQQDNDVSGHNRPSRILLHSDPDPIDVRPPTPKATGNLLRSSPDMELRNLRTSREDEKVESAVTTVAADGVLRDAQTQSQPPPRYHPDTALSAHPLFPPLPSYSPPSLALTVRCVALRCVSFVLSLLFLGVVVIGALVGFAGRQLENLRMRIRGEDPHARRKFYAEERERQWSREEELRRWKRRQAKRDVDEEAPDECPPLEGGPDLLVCDVRYYARRVGLDVETFKVQTEDGFIITLWHVFNPQEYTPLSEEERGPRGPDVFTGRRRPNASGRNQRYPVLLVHGLLQSAGAFCVNDDDSLAFYLCKAGYDVWLGNNRCGMTPEHTTLSTGDPRMWTWNIRQMGVLDLTALVSRVLFETGFEKLGLRCILATMEETLAEMEEDVRLQRDGDQPGSRTDTAWYGPQTPPFALWVAGSDALVDGRRLLQRLHSGREPHVQVVHSKVIEEYEHLDVLWAMDAVEQVGQEVRDVIYRTMPEAARKCCRVPKGVS
ncbi:hypothetical protein KXX50_002001 [Aspergillus fumigatus]|nr:hypothetical protein KXX50_002001 [Aspergillus fumigatus]KAH1954395.1 hypothetical protein KXV59_003551 [Aspergillus fumigatus]KAH1966964.1 hypothetical protein KXX04_001553 [Aspergillus fumigatus]KAH3059699.1 hypothetical protein KXW16_002183 [Aspergillus fumigatus]